MSSDPAVEALRFYRDRVLGYVKPADERPDSAVSFMAAVLEFERRTREALAAAEGRGCAHRNLTAAVAYLGSGWWICDDCDTVMERSEKVGAKVRRDIVAHARAAGAQPSWNGNPLTDAPPAPGDFPCSKCRIVHTADNPNCGPTAVFDAAGRSEHCPACESQVLVGGPRGHYCPECEPEMGG